MEKPIDGDTLYFHEFERYVKDHFAPPDDLIKHEEAVKELWECWKRAFCTGALSVLDRALKHQGKT